MNCTPFVRQYDIMSNKWGEFFRYMISGLYREGGAAVKFAR